VVLGFDPVWGRSGVPSNVKLEVVSGGDRQIPVDNHERVASDVVENQCLDTDDIHSPVKPAWDPFSFPPLPEYAETGLPPVFLPPSIDQPHDVFIHFQWSWVTDFHVARFQ
jgi:hypothetical protein